MKKKALCLSAVLVAVLALVLTVFTGSQVEPAFEPERTVAEREALEELPDEDDAESPDPEIVTETESEPADEPVLIPQKEKETDRSEEKAVPADIVPEDTVRYVESSKIEITRTETYWTDVDEDDPSTYRVVREEHLVDVEQEIPSEYQDETGNIQYAWRDGIWYAYEYSSSDITLDENDEETALMLLELMGDGDGEVVSVSCEELTDEAGGISYAFHVLYQSETVMDEEPVELDGLKISATRTETVQEKRTVKKKVSVKRKRTVPTGEYIYYGWQDLNGGRYYYDENGTKVTGTQVIQGIRYEFDQDGKLISPAGAL